MSAAKRLTTPNSMEDLFDRYGAKYRWLAVSAVGVGTFSALLMSTIINVAIPAIMGAYGIGQRDAQWLSTGFLASATITMLMSGWCLDRFGIQKSLFFSTLLFSGSCLLAAVTADYATLVLSRILQGLAYGFFLPMGTYVMTRIFPSEKQGLGMSIFGVMAVLGPTIGPYIGGLAVDNFGWRSVFLIPLPMTVVALPLAIFFLPGPDRTVSVGRFDWQSLALLSVAVILLLVWLGNGQTYGWNSDQMVYCMAASVASALIFLHRQQQVQSPLLNLSLFKNRNFLLASLLSAVLGAALFGVMYIVPLFMQIIQEFGPTEAGLALLPAGAVMALAFPISGHFSDRMPPHWLIISGMMLLGYSTIVMVTADHFTTFGAICWWLILGRLGLVLVRPALYRTAFSTLVPGDLAQAAGSINFIRQLGGAFGVTFTSVYLERGTSIHLDRITSTQTEANFQSQEMVELLQSDLHQAGIEPAMQEQLAAQIFSSELYNQATLMGFHDTFLILGIAIFLSTIPGAMLRDSPKRDRGSATPAP